VLSKILFRKAWVPWAVFNSKLSWLQHRVKFSLLVVTVCIVAILDFLLCWPPVCLVLIFYKRWRCVFTRWLFLILFVNAFAFASAPQSQVGGPKDKDNGNYPENVSDESVQNCVRVVHVCVFWVAIAAIGILLRNWVEERVNVDHSQYDDDYPHVLQGRLHTVDIFAACGQWFNDLCEIYCDCPANINKNGWKHYADKFWNIKNVTLAVCYLINWVVVILKPKNNNHEYQAEHPNNPQEIDSFHLVVQQLRGLFCEEVKEQVEDEKIQAQAKTQQESIYRRVVQIEGVTNCN